MYLICITDMALFLLAGYMQIQESNVLKKMAEAGGTIAAIQPIQMADTTGEDNIAGTWPSMGRTMESYG